MFKLINAFRIGILEDRLIDMEVQPKFLEKYFISELISIILYSFQSLFFVPVTD